MEYRILQTRLPGATIMVVFSGLAFNTIISGLRPFTQYQYQVFARNSAGNVTSISTTNTTLPAPPTFIAAPMVMVQSSSEILVSWEPPAELNGMFVGYQLYRNGVAIFQTYTSSLTFMDSNLSPFTEYEYVVEVCSSGGCVNSSSVTNVTLEALPGMVGGLTISDITPRSIRLTWSPPGTPNGIITEYVLTQVTPTSLEVFRGAAAFSALAADLVPYMVYSFNLMVCNGAGCVTTDSVQNRTLETDPEQIDSPRLRNLTSTSVAIEWSAPRVENGLITTYILRRGNNSFPGLSRVIFQGLAFSFNDVSLVADTLYFYTVTAVNGGGSVTSNQSFFQTVPDLAEGIRPPTLRVQGPTSIHVQWFAPDLANGDISAYRLFVNGNLEFTGIAFEFTVMNLQPFTSYSVFVEVCNQAGCASSTTVSNTTEQAIPQGVSPPTLTVLGPRQITVAWVPPTQPNGIITQYQIQRRIPGDIFSLSLQHVGGPDVLMFPNSGLTPFTTYEYRLRITNGAGSVFSEWTSAQTSEDIPTGVAIPMFRSSDISARNVTAAWTPPTSPNGVITSYLLEYRIAIDPVTFGPGEIITGATLPANVMVATVGNLQPVTSYEFRIVANNGAGRGESLFELVTTGEDVPEGIQEVLVDQRTGFSLTLSWNQPTAPHGTIREYILLLDGVMVYRGIPPTTITGLTPFTSYSIQLAACTSAGCGFGIEQYITTAETAPLGQGQPSLMVSEEGAVLVTWNPPLQPNGIILQYQVLRYEDGIVTIVNVTSNVLVRRFVDSDVRPARSYSYAVRVINAVGQTDSTYNNISTPEAAPGGVTPPTLTPLSSFAMQVSWLPPMQPNGQIIRYEVFRTSTSAANVSVFSHPSDRGFSDVDLLPFTEYSYTVLVCTAAGCTLSQPATERTLEATPTNISRPVLVSLSFSSISLSWSVPASPNGIIIMYNIDVFPSGITLAISGSETRLHRNITGLLPFTNYVVTVEACNSVGCVAGNSSVRTDEHIPQVSLPPTVTVLNATALSVVWAQPAPPNGIIIRYELRRDGTSVFNGTRTSFIDYPLTPREVYSYTVQSFTVVGGSEQSRPSDSVTTPSDTPQDILPPSLTATGPTSVFANWSEPLLPNGVIQRYILLQNGSNIHDMLGFQLAVIGLLPFTTYSYQIMACTTTCNSSTAALVTTLEAPPQGLAAPALSEGSEQSVTITWSPPSNLNGIITRYEVWRRMDSTSSAVQVFSGLELSYTDTDTSLRPDTSYEYSIIAFNSAGNTASNSTGIRLAEAPPTSVAPPIIDSITATSLDVTVTPPSMPNGILVAYRLLINGSLYQNITPPAAAFRVTSLSPFTVYEFVLEACTSAGCTPSASVTARTGEAPPTGLVPPAASVIQEQSSIEVSWQPPAATNGIILR